MKSNMTLTITSLLLILFVTFHLAGDIVLGYEQGGLANLAALPIFVVWLYGTLIVSGGSDVWLRPRLAEPKT